MLIVGASGRLGSVVAQRLLAQGKPVRAMTRNPLNLAHLQEKSTGDAISPRTTFRNHCLPRSVILGPWRQTADCPASRLTPGSRFAFALPRGDNGCLARCPGQHRHRSDQEGIARSLVGLLGPFCSIPERLSCRKRRNRPCPGVPRSLPRLPLVQSSLARWSDAGPGWSWQKSSNLGRRRWRGLGSGNNRSPTHPLPTGSEPGSGSLPRRSSPDAGRRAITKRPPPCRESMR